MNKKIMVQNGSMHIFIIGTMWVSIHVTCGLFIAQSNSSFKHTYATVTARSATECCVHCKHEDSCNSVNFCPIDKTCELNDRSPADFPYSDVIATPNTDLYYVSTDPCPESWILYNRHCYLVVSSIQTWEQSEDNCKRMGAYLTDVLDDFENTFVSQIGYDAGVGWLWLGLGTYHIIKPQLWTSGKQVSYTHFYPNEPNNQGGNEGCIQLCIYLGGTWNDLMCSYPMPSVCKKRHY